MTQKQLIKTDFAPSFHAVCQVKYKAKIIQSCLQLLAKI